MLKKSVYQSHQRLLLKHSTSQIQTPSIGVLHIKVEAELGVLQYQGTFGEAEQYGQVMKTKFVFTTSFFFYSGVKYKAHLVVCGYSQVFGVDYEETFAPTTPITNIILLVQITTVKKAVIVSFDVTGAFLEGTNDYE
jgi:hypothetical protein